MKLADGVENGEVRAGAPSSEFILKRILRHDMEGTPGWRLNAEMRGEFTRMLREQEAKKSRERVR